MSANTEKRRHSLANFQIDDPGASGTISGRNSGFVNIVTAGAESRTVDAPVRGGLELTLNGKTLAGAATIAVTNYIGSDDSLVLSANGDCIVLKSVDVNGTLTWKQVGGTKWEAATLTTVTATTVNATTVNATTTKTSALNRSGVTSVTQGSNINTTVISQGLCGRITTVSASTGAGAEDSFTVTNDSCAAGTTLVNCSIGSYAGTIGTNGVPFVSAIAANGSFTVTVSNLHATNSLSGALVIIYELVETVA